MSAVADRKVLITGGTAGIGLATAELLLSLGCRVFVCGRQASRLDAAVSELRRGAAAERISGSVCDVRSPQETASMVAVAADFLGGIDALVNSAGVAVVADFSELSAEDWQQMLETNLSGVFNCCKAALPWLVDSEQADIVNLGSRSGRYAFAGGTAYCATKSGLQGFSEALFLDVGARGIGVSLIAPGTVATGFGNTEPEDWHLRAEDVARVVADVLSSDRRANLNWVELRPSRRDA